MKRRTFLKGMLLAFTPPAIILNSKSLMKLSVIDDGLIIGKPTGYTKGIGTLNVEGYYEEGGFLVPEDIAELIKKDIQDNINIRQAHFFINGTSLNRSNNKGLIWNVEIF